MWRDRRSEDSGPEDGEQEQIKRGAGNGSSFVFREKLGVRAGAEFAIMMETDGPGAIGPGYWRGL